MPYEWRGSGPLRRGSEYIDPGETFEPSDAEVSAFGDLMREVAEEAEGADESGSSEDAPEESNGDEDAEEEPTCAGKDGECTRPVDEPGDYCWQHEEQPRLTHGPNIPE